MRKWLDELSVPAGFSAVIVFGGAVAYYILKGEFDLTMRGLVALAILLLAAFLYGNSSAMRGSVGVRQMKYGANATVMVAVLIGILALANVLADRNTQRWDLTASKDYSLSEQTVQILKNLKEPVKVTAFFSGQDSRMQQAQDLLKEYSTRSDKVTAEFIDPDIRPTEAERYQIMDYGTLVFQSGSRRQDVTGTDESDITSAILKVTSGEQRRVAFLTGHGERSIDSFDRPGFGQAKALLDTNNYKVETINLSTSPTLTADLAVLIVASPRTALLSHEVDAIRRYLDEGGHVLVLSDPHMESNLSDVTGKWGVEVGKGIAIDQSMAYLGDLGILVVQQYRRSPITEKLRAMAVLPLATNVKTGNPNPDGITYTPIAEVTDKGWVETDLNEAKFDESADLKGPVSLAVAVEERGKPKMVVFGDSDFASNEFLRAGANSDLLINSVNWLAQSGQGNEQLAAIVPKQPSNRSLVFTAAQGSFILFLSAVVLPGLVLLGGAAVWLARR